MTYDANRSKNAMMNVDSAFRLEATGIERQPEKEQPAALIQPMVPEKAPKKNEERERSRSKDKKEKKDKKHKDKGKKEKKHGKHKDRKESAPRWQDLYDI